MKNKPKCDSILGAVQTGEGAVAKWQGRGLQNPCSSDSFDPRLPITPTESESVQEHHAFPTLAEIGEGRAKPGVGPLQNSGQCNKPLAVSCGGGVNSGGMLVGMYERGIIPDLILFADTGAEKPETYEFVDRLRTWTVRNMNVGIVALANDGMYGTLENECLTRHTLPSLVMGWRSCSDKYKLRPQHKYVARFYGSPDAVRWVVGIDAGESARRKSFENCWQPLVEWGWDRSACVAALIRAGLPVPNKSACFFCPASTKREVIQLSKEHPDLFARAVAMESEAQGLRVSGLGRHWSWRELVAADKAQFEMFPETVSTPCMCFDGDSE